MSKYIETCKSYLKLNDDFFKYCDERPNELSVKVAIYFLNFCKELEPTISPMISGGISVTFKKDNSFINLSFNNKGKIYVLYVNNGAEEMLRAIQHEEFNDVLSDVKALCDAN